MYGDECGKGREGKEEELKEGEDCGREREEKEEKVWKSKSGRN